MDGVNIINAWQSGQDRGAILEPNRGKLLANLERAERKKAEQEELLKTLPRRTVSFDKHVLPANPWFACETVEYSLRALAPYLDTKTLFALNWRFGGKAGRAARGESPERMDALFEEWIDKADRNGWVLPRAAFGVYPCQSDGDEVVVCDPGDPSRELGRFGFAVVVGAGKEDVVCASQYFAPAGSDKMDAIGVQIATSGPQVDEQLAAFRESGDSEATLYLQGLSDRVAEDLAGRVHAMLRQRLGFDADRGIRWSPGYPAIPDTQYNKTILQLLNAAGQIGVTITDAGEFSPTGSTAAVVCFHPDARYT